MPNACSAGLYLPNFGTFADPRTVARLATVAEAAGWRGLFVWDHTVRHEGDLDLADPWIVLAAVATATERLVIGPLVTPLARRRPWNVAKAAVTLDHLSGGRVVLGVGLGSSRGPEFAAFGEATDPRTRGDMLDEALEVVRAAWTGAPVTQRGTHYRIDGIRFLPRPVRPEGIPIWGATESVVGRPARRAARLDGVFPIGVAPDRLGQLLDGIRAHRPGGHLRDYDVVVTSGGEDLQRWMAAGATWWLRLLPHDLPLAEALAVVGDGPPA